MDLQILGYIIKKYNLKHFFLRIIFTNIIYSRVSSITFTLNLNIVDIKSFK